MVGRSDGWHLYDIFLFSVISVLAFLAVAVAIAFLGYPVEYTKCHFGGDARERGREGGREGERGRERGRGRESERERERDERKQDL